MAVSNDFLEYVLDQLSPWGEVTVRRMFGGAGLYRDGIIFGIVMNNVSYLKVDESNRDKFMAAGSKPLKPFPNKQEVLSYFEVPPDIFEDADELISWSEESLSIQMKKGK